MEIKCQLDATEVFIADLIACSTFFGHHYARHQELKSIIQWLLSVVFRAVFFKLLVWCGAEGYVSGLQDVAASCKPDRIHIYMLQGFRYFGFFCLCFGQAVAQFVQAVRYKPDSRGVRSPMVSLEFFIHIILPAAQWP